MSQGVLVEVRCKTCRKLLNEVVSAPPRHDEDHWASYVCIQLCQQHGDGAGHGNIARWKERQRQAGKDPDRVQTHQWVQWADLRPAVEQARRTSRTWTHLV